VRWGGNFSFLSRLEEARGGGKEERGRLQGHRRGLQQRKGQRGGRSPTANFQRKKKKKDFPERKLTTQEQQEGQITLHSYTNFPC